MDVPDWRRPGRPPKPVPLTMQAYGLRGTPSLLVFDRQGRLFG
jgi:hypothetical protein